MSKDTGLVTVRWEHKDAEIAKLSDLVESWSDMAINMEKHIDKLKADNAAKDARIKELEADVKREAQSSTHNAQDCLDEQLRAEALEAKLAAAEKALESKDEEIKKLKKLASYSYGGD